MQYNKWWSVQAPSPGFAPHLACSSLGSQTDSKSVRTWQGQQRGTTAELEKFLIINLDFKLVCNYYAD